MTTTIITAPQPARNVCLVFAWQKLFLIVYFTRGLLFLIPFCSSHNSLHWKSTLWMKYSYMMLLLFLFSHLLLLSMSNHLSVCVGLWWVVCVPLSFIKGRIKSKSKTWKILLFSRKICSWNSDFSLYTIIFLDTKHFVLNFE